MPETPIPMTPKEIHQALAGICASFPKSGKTFVGFIDHAAKTGAMEGTMQHAGVISMKNAWQLENKAPHGELRAHGREGTRLRPQRLDKRGSVRSKDVGGDRPPGKPD